MKISKKKKKILYLCIVAMSSWHHFESWKVTGDEFDFVDTSPMHRTITDSNRLLSDYRPTVDRLSAQDALGNASIRSDSIPFPTELL